MGVLTYFYIVILYLNALCQVEIIARLMSVYKRFKYKRKYRVRTLSHNWKKI